MKNQLIKKVLKKRQGFTLLEVIAVTALLGVLSSLLLPSFDGVNAKTRNAKLENDFAVIDNAIMLYKLENGTCPADLGTLLNGYIAKNNKIQTESDFKDATGASMVYAASGNTYSLKGKQVDATEVYSNGSTVPADS